MLPLSCEELEELESKDIDVVDLKTNNMLMLNSPNLRCFGAQEPERSIRLSNPKVLVS
jgi:hypothetical protein